MIEILLDVALPDNGVTSFPMGSVHVKVIGRSGVIAVQDSTTVDPVTSIEPSEGISADTLKGTGEE